MIIFSRFHSNAWIIFTNSVVGTRIKGEKVEQMELCFSQIVTYYNVLLL
ncbi:hypothetical protein I3842_16G062800 [Carya illinoinensis]|uniref:Uncharacterized protein n=1 Tax=Carya illinoinensis TaxID=32201 RepID=A0A922D125_CARIL|nr:hypothetical protein I3842_16G062800 [Carya illinoinensis]